MQFLVAGGAGPSRARLDLACPGLPALGRRRSGWARVGKVELGQAVPSQTWLAGMSDRPGQVKPSRAGPGQGSRPMSFAAPEN